MLLNELSPSGMGSRRGTNVVRPIPSSTYERLRCVQKHLCTGIYSRDLCMDYDYGKSFRRGNCAFTSSTTLRLRFVFFLACSEKYKAGSSGPGWPNVGTSREPPPPDFFRPKSHRGALSPAGGTLLPSGKSQEARRGGH